MVGKSGGHLSRIAKLGGKYEGKRCFVMGNGPSLNEMDLSPLKNEVTIGSNGIFKVFDSLGIQTTFYTMEDQAQIEDRRHDLGKIDGPLRIFPLRSAYCIPQREDTIFVNLVEDSYPKHRYKDLYPQFSPDFAASVYLGSTVTYFNLQLAFHLGCDPVYLIGVDHDYGELTKLFPPGKIEVTREVYEKLKGIHMADGYHKIGGKFGVPYVEEQEKAYRKARESFEADGRKILNAGLNSKLDIFERADFSELFSSD